MKKIIWIVLLVTLVACASAPKIVDLSTSTVEKTQILDKHKIKFTVPAGWGIVEEHMSNDNKIYSLRLKDNKKTTLNLLFVVPQKFGPPYPWNTEKSVERVVNVAHDSAIDGYNKKYDKLTQSPLNIAPNGWVGLQSDYRRVDVRHNDNLGVISLFSLYFGELLSGLFLDARLMSDELTSKEYLEMKNMLFNIEII